MIKEVRVLAISKETKSYSTEKLMGVFGCNNPALDVVETMPPTTAINLINDAGWRPIGPAENCEYYICAGFIRDIIE